LEEGEQKLCLFLIGAQDIQSGARAKAILDLASPNAQMEWNALFCWPRHANMTFEDVFGHVIFEATAYHYNNSVNCDHSALFLLVDGSISIAFVFGVDKHFENLVCRKFHPVLFGTNKGCPKSRCKAREKVQRGGGKGAFLIAASYLVLAVLLRNNSVTKYRNPCTDLSNAFIANLLD
jgi:hypothetical protein